MMEYLTYATVPDTYGGYLFYLVSLFILTFTVTWLSAFVIVRLFFREGGRISEDTKHTLAWGWAWLLGVIVASSYAWLLYFSSRFDMTVALIPYGLNIVIAFVITFILWARIHRVFKKLQSRL